MAEILTDTSPAGMLTAISEGLGASFVLLATAAHGEVRRAEGITAAVTGLPISDFNGVYRTQLEPGLTNSEIDRRIAEVVTFLRSRGVPFSWWAMPDERVPDLPTRLVAQGFALDEKRPGMAIDLNQLGGLLSAPEGVTVEEVKDRDGLGEHLRLLEIVYGMPAEIVEKFRVVQQGLPLGPEAPIRYFLAFAQGKPVGTSLVVLSGGAAGIFNVATVPAARGRGIGALTTDVALRAAREVGYRIVVLESTAMGYNVYRRLGFVEYCQIGHYVWRQA
jgi:GNAT superfamily N-acetyltransferase